MSHKRTAFIKAVITWALAAAVCRLLFSIKVAAIRLYSNIAGAALFVWERNVKIYVCEHYAINKHTRGCEAPQEGARRSA